MSNLLKLPKNKVKKITPNIFTAMNQVALETSAINLAQGFPNFPCSEELVALVTHYMKAGYNQYPPMPGVLALREAIAEKLEFLYGTTCHPDTEITITPGGHNALSSAVTSVIHPGDEVIVFEPAFDCFTPLLELNGAVPVAVELHGPEFNIDWNLVRQKITARTRMIIINSPHNPSGRILSAHDISQLISITSNTDILILSDEVYEHLVFDGQEHLSVCRYPELKERSFVVFSFGKVFHTTGWKIAYCLAPKELMERFRQVHQMTTFCVNAPMQYAIAEYLKKRDHYLGLPKFYQAKRDLFLNLIQGSRFISIATQGSYFQLCSYQKISDLPETEMAIKLAREIKVAGIPISSFYTNKVENQILRFCFAKTDETLKQAAARLCEA